MLLLLYILTQEGEWSEPQSWRVCRFGFSTVSWGWLYQGHSQNEYILRREISYSDRTVQMALAHKCTIEAQLRSQTLDFPNRTPVPQQIRYRQKNPEFWSLFKSTHVLNYGHLYHKKSILVIRKYELGENQGVKQIDSMQVRITYHPCKNWESINVAMPCWLFCLHWLQTCNWLDQFLSWK